MPTIGAGAGYPGLRQSRAEPLDWVTQLGLPVSVAILFGVSGGMLWDLGYNYDGLTGSAATKIHPFTYMVVILFVCRAIGYGNPVGYIVHVAHSRPAAVLMGLAALLLLVVTIARKGTGMAGLIDTFVGPALLVVLLADAKERAMARIATLLHVLMTVNALMALGEFVTKVQLFPYRFDGEIFPIETRSTALQGHPLVNSLVTACYLLALLTGGRSLPIGSKALMIGLQSVAMVTFGGRSGLVVVLLFGGAYAVFALFRSLRSGRVSLVGAAAALMLLALAPVAIGAAGATGFFDILLGRFASDGGSANARVEMLDLFDNIPLRDLIVGPDIDLVASLRRINGLELGIENPIIRMTLYQGAFLTLILAIALGLFLYELTRDREPGTWLPMVGLLILLNTSESIADKTTLLAKFAVIILCLYRPSRRRETKVTISRAAWSAPAPR